MRAGKIGRLIIKKAPSGYTTTTTSSTSTPSSPPISRSQLAQLAPRLAGLPIPSWTVEDVTELLRLYNLVKYEQTFEEEGVDGLQLCVLDHQDCVEELRMTKLHAKKLLSLVNILS